MNFHTICISKQHDYLIIRFSQYAHYPHLNSLTHPRRNQKMKDVPIFPAFKVHD